jgi:inorganic pyrophosphatase
MTMEDEGELGYNVTVTHVNDPEYNSYQSVHELPPHRLPVIRCFVSFLP